MRAVKTGPDTNQPEAYAKYMKAEFFANMRTQNSLAKAIDLLQQAIPDRSQVCARLRGA